LRTSEYIAVDYEAHAREHAIEVQVPFLLADEPGGETGPADYAGPDPEIFHDVGRSLAAVAKKLADRRVLFVASTDLTHYESARPLRARTRRPSNGFSPSMPMVCREIVHHLGLRCAG